MDACLNGLALVVSFCDVGFCGKSLGCVRLAVDMVSG